MTNERINAHLDNLILRHEELSSIRNSIESTYELMEDCYSSGGKLLIAGNGGSAADSQHIAGELMKSLILKRPIHKELADKLIEYDPERGKTLSEKIEMGLPAISLSAHESLVTAYINDVYVEGVFAQQVLTLGKKNDVLWCISTSGNSENIICAAIIAKSIGMKVVGLTGGAGGRIKDYSDTCICVPEHETYKIQELHLPVYHCLCMMLEERFFG